MYMIDLVASRALRWPNDQKSGISDLTFMEHQETFDPGSLYGTTWAETIIQQIQDFIRSNTEWISLSSTTSQRVLDYACGNGTVSTALLDYHPKATFQGIDSHPEQVKRFNKVANERTDASGQRIWAIEGDLTKQYDALATAEWFDFDVVIISMALHHVSDPIDMLKRLRQRARPGGVLVVVEMTPEPGDNDAANEDNKNAGKTHVHHGHHASHAHAAGGRVEVIGGQRIWPGFTVTSLSAAMDRAGFSAIEGRVHPQTFTIPEGAGPSGSKRLIFVKGVVVS